MGHAPKKSGLHIRPLFIVHTVPLARGNRVYRAGISTGATIRAGVGVDDKLVIPLADGFHRTGGLAGATGNAFARNDIGHDFTPYWLVGLFLRKFAAIYQQKT
jgi:hypothetical protein